MCASETAHLQHRTRNYGVFLCQDSADFCRTPGFTVLMFSLQHNGANMLQGCRYIGHDVTYLSIRKTVRVIHRNKEKQQRSGADVL